MIRIFPDFSVQVTASAAGGAGAGGGGGGGGGGGMVTGPPVGRVPVPVPGATNGTPQSVQGITAYQQRYVGSCRKTTCSVMREKEKERNVKCRKVRRATANEEIILWCFSAAYK